MSDDATLKDDRKVIYKRLHAVQLSEEKAPAEYSSRRALEVLFEAYRPNSLLDVGCGLGLWLKTAMSLGVAEVKGIEGEWVDPALLEVSPDLVEVHDLEKGFDLKRKFDLVICLEVAEHLSESAADDFIASLVRHAPVVLFSAAVPFQGGDHHVNERFLSYWADKFAQHGFRPADIIRREIWTDERVLLWLRQNAMVFAHEGLIAQNERLHRPSQESPLPFSVIHPELYLIRAGELYKLRDHFKIGGFYEVQTTARSGDLALVRVTETVEEMRRLTDLLRTGGFYYAAVGEAGALTVTKAEGKVDELERLSSYMESGGLFHATRTSSGGFTVEKVGKSLEELQTLRNYIAGGGLFRVIVGPSGDLQVAKVSEPSLSLKVKS
jgi:SAM-dependent methyltransferase